MDGDETETQVLLLVLEVVVEPLVVVMVVVLVLLLPVRTCSHEKTSGGLWARPSPSTKKPLPGRVERETGRHVGRTPRATS